MYSISPMLDDGFKYKIMNYKQPIIGSAFAFILATSCCWLPALIIGLGGASSMLAFANGLERFSGLFMVLGLITLLYGVFLYRKKNSVASFDEVQLNSTITCPKCDHQQEEIMPTNACQYFYECTNCEVVIKPLKGDCCVYCSYGSVDCPPIQQNKNCC